MRILTALSVPLAASIAVLFGGAAWADPPAGSSAPESVVWTPKELRFTYMGFTSRYSCDGLREKIQKALLRFGARKDLHVNETGCSGGFGRPTSFPGVVIKMNVLAAPASEKDKKDTEAAAPVSAHWKLVDLTASRDPLDVAGDCELIEQIKQRIVPLFTTRSIEYKSSCVPNQLQLGSTQLKGEFLIADEASPKPAATQ